MPKTVSRGKPKKNKSLELLRIISDKFAESVNLDKDLPAHALSGLASQYMGVDPETGEVGETAWHNLKASWDGHPERKRMPGLVTDTMSLPNMFGNGPGWSKRAQRNADDTHDLVRHSMSLESPHGFGNVSADAMGTIMGQLPIPAKGGKAVGNTLKDFLLAIPEYLSPTTEARLGNYVTGGLGVGALDQAMQGEAFPGMIRGMLMPEELPQDPRIQLHEDTGDYAEGGKVGHLTELLRAINLNPDSRATRSSRPYRLGDPMEEVLYAARQGVETGRMTELERRQIIEAVSHQENEEQLQATLAALHAKLFPTDPALLRPTYPGPVPDYSYVDKDSGVRGTLSDEEWNAMIERRMKDRNPTGGKIP